MSRSAFFPKHKRWLGMSRSAFFPKVYMDHVHVRLFAPVCLVAQTQIRCSHSALELKMSLFDAPGVLENQNTCACSTMAEWLNGDSSRVLNVEKLRSTYYNILMLCLDQLLLQKSLDQSMQKPMKKSALCPTNQKTTMCLHMCWVASLLRCSGKDTMNDI